MTEIVNSVDNTSDNTSNNTSDNTSSCEPVFFGIVLVVLAIMVLPFTIIAGVCIGVSYLTDYIKLKCKKTNVEQIRI